MRRSSTSICRTKLDVCEDRLQPDNILLRSFWWMAAASRRLPDLVPEGINALEKMPTETICSTALDFLAFGEVSVIDRLPRWTCPTSRTAHASPTC